MSAQECYLDRWEDTQRGESEPRTVGHCDYISMMKHAETALHALTHICA